jgi:hypothetical protein
LPRNSIIFGWQKSAFLTVNSIGVLDIFNDRFPVVKMADIYAQGDVLTLALFREMCHDRGGELWESDIIKQNFTVIPTCSQVALTLLSSCSLAGMEA